MIKKCILGAYLKMMQNNIFTSNVMLKIDVYIFSIYMKNNILFYLFLTIIHLFRTTFNNTYNESVLFIIKILHEIQKKTKQIYVHFFSRFHFRYIKLEKYLQICSQISYLKKSLYQELLIIK